MEHFKYKNAGTTQRKKISVLSLCALLVILFAIPAYAAKPYDKAYIGEITIYKTKYEDTMVKIARDNDLGFVELRAANPYVDPWLPGEGTEMLLPAMHLLPLAKRKGIVMNLPEMRLYYYKDAGKPPLTYPIGVGREGLLTPMGTTRVRAKKVGPTWRPTKRMREEDPELPASVPPGPDNPLGTHALYLGWPQYAIHGTDKPYGIGRRVSSGCIRMYPEDIVEIFPNVPVDTPVTTVDQPVKAAWIENEFYIEAHPTLEQADKMEQEGGALSYEVTEEDLRLILEVAGDDAGLLDWPKIRRVIRKRNGYPVVIMSRPATESTTANSEDRSEASIVSQGDDQPS